MTQQDSTDTATAIIQRGLAYWEPRLADRRDQPLAALNQQRSLFFTAISHGLRHKVSQHALSLFQQQPQAATWQAAALTSLGTIYQQQKKSPAKAEAYLLEAANIWQEAKRPVRAARVYGTLASVNITRQTYESAHTYLQQAFALIRPADLPVDEINFWVTLGLLHYEQAAWAEAERAFLQIVQPRLAKWATAHQMAVTYNNLGNVLRQTGQYAEAQRYLYQAIAAWDAGGPALRQSADKGNSVGSLGEVHFDRQEWEKAAAAFEAALEILQQQPSGNAWVESLMATFRDKLAQATAKLIHTEHPTEHLTTGPK